MTKKKRTHPDVDEVLSRPWCYYCERDFDDLKILISHQKARHFKCNRCNRRLNTAGGLSVHMTQVHKENLDAVENALPNRVDVNIEIFGMEGIPEDVLMLHNQRVTQQFYQEEAERRAQTGNPPPGTGGRGGVGVKRAKKETPEEIKKRLAEHKAKKAAEAAAAAAGNAAPTPNPQASPAANSPFQAYPTPFAAPQASPPAPVYSQPYGVLPMYGAPQGQFPQPGFSASPINAPPFGPPPGQPFPQYSQPAVGGYGAPPFHQPQYPQQAFYPPNPNPYPPRSQHSPPPTADPRRQNSLANAPGLPQRPSFNAPQVNRSQLQEMHQGHIPGQGQPQANEQTEQPSHTQDGKGGAVVPTITSQDVDDLIASATAAGAAQKTELGSATEQQTTAKETAAAKKGEKKGKGAPTRLIFGADKSEISPEEKMAALPRYQKMVQTSRDKTKEDTTTLGTAEPMVTNPALGSDDVMDGQGD
ncbi:hypothetical protein LTR66_012890 [Elasticomyces elasticus]|nr:hypothetical protein LTR66_012890 [Elasticomyces elasticus]